MKNRDRYLALANRISNWFEKPSALIAAVAFLSMWTFVALLIGISIAGILIATMTINLFILAMVFLVQHAHKSDIRSLQAKLGELIEAGKLESSGANADRMSDTELQQLRQLLKRQADNDSGPFVDKDQRPSLF
ncbi:MAG: hypothetical protein JWM58_4511 [Rhizobium sp.]|nr:hypothetical protein [Rhizobium sp.]